MKEEAGDHTIHEISPALQTVLSPTLQKVNSTVTGVSLATGMPQPKVYLIGERLATVHNVLGKYGLAASRTANMSQFDRRRTSPDASAMLQAIAREEPYLVWIQWSPKMVQSGRRGGVRTAIEFFSGLVKLQKDAGRHVIIEGKAADVPVRDEVFTAPNRYIGVPWG